MDVDFRDKTFFRFGLLVLFEILFYPLDQLFPFWYFLHLHTFGDDDFVIARNGAIVLVIGGQSKRAVFSSKTGGLLAPGVIGQKNQRGLGNRFAVFPGENPFCDNRVQFAAAAAAP